MEGSDYVEGTLELYRRLHASHPNTGICLQAYLHRTAADIQSLLPTNPAVRLVKGAYAEPASIAYQKRPEVDANYVALALAMLEGIRAAGRSRSASGRTTCGWSSRSRSTRSRWAWTSGRSRSRCSTASAPASSAGSLPRATASAT